MLLASGCFVLMGMAMKTIGERLPLFEVVFIRSVVTFVSIAILCRAKGVPIFGQRHLALFLRGFVGFLSLSLGFFALTRIPIATTTALWKTSALFAAFLSRLLPHERTTRGEAALIALGFLGVLLVLQPGSGALHPAAFAALGAGLAVGVVAHLIRTLGAHEHPYTIVAAFSFYSALCAVIASSGVMTPPPASTWIPLLTIGISGTIGQLAFTHAFRFGSAPVIQSFAYSEVIYALLAGWLWWGEWPNAVATLGTTIIVLSGVLLARART